MKRDTRSFSVLAQVPVEEGTTFKLNNRRGKVVQLRSTSCLVLWEEQVDPETGEILHAISDTISNDDFCRYDMHGRLTIVRRPSAAACDGSRDRSHRTEAEVGRMRFRLAYVEAAQQLISEGVVAESRAGFRAKVDRILALGTVYYNRFLAQKAGAAGKRGGAVINIGTQSSPPKSAANIYTWYSQYRKGGQNALFDSYHTSGNRGRRYSDAERELAQSVINQRLDQERCSIASIVSSVRAVFNVHNDNASRSNPPGPFLNTPRYDYISATIKAMAPLDHAIRTRGLKVAYRDMHALGVGVQAERALARVEIDDYTFDLMVLLSAVGVWDWLRPEERAMLGLDGTPRRVTMSAAIDVHTRCIVGMKISAGDTRALLRDTVEMIFLDKAPISDAVGAHERWNMHGRPEMIVIDRGPNYLTEETYALLADLGITNLGAPAKMPWLRPFIERLFRTIHSGFAQRFSGRTFSNVVQRGENDPAARASLDLDEFLQWLVRWIVDFYHNKKHPGLLNRTPAEAWAQSQVVSQLQGVSREEMRRVFGIRRHRTLGPGGITMMNIRYQTDELARIFFAPPLQPKVLEVAWWPHDIGTISVKVAPDRWMNVTASDPEWVGKSFDDLMMVRFNLAGERDRSERVMARAVSELDVAAFRNKALRGLLPTIVNDAIYDRYEADFLRFMSTAERSFDASEPLGLLDDIVELPSADDIAASSSSPLMLPAPNARSARVASAENDDDLME